MCKNEIETTEQKLFLSKKSGKSRILQIVFSKLNVCTPTRSTYDTITLHNILA